MFSPYRFTYFTLLFVLALGTLGLASPVEAYYNQCSRYDYQVDRVVYQIQRLRDSQSLAYDRIDDIQYSRDQALQRIEYQYESTVLKYANCSQGYYSEKYTSYRRSYSSSYCRNADYVLSRAEQQRDYKLSTTNASYDRREYLARVQAQRRYDSYEYRIQNLMNRIYELEEQKEYCEWWYYS